MANIINFTYQSEKIIKDYGTTTKLEQELFQGKYEGCKYIYGGCLWADKACEYVADDGNDGWLIFGLHPGAEEFNETQQQYLKDVIEYVKSKNIEIVTLNNGYDVFGNAVETGNVDYYKGIALGYDGTNNIPIARLKDLTYKNEDDIALFPKNKVSIAQIGNYQNANFPESTGGILEIWRTTDFNFQKWYPANDNNVYKRIYTNRWLQWELISDGKKIITLNVGITNNTPISSFTKDKFTITHIGTYDNANFPENKAGILITYRHLTNDIFSYQIFNSAATGCGYKRLWTGLSWGGMDTCSRDSK